jgi:ParB family chromosome partitioning protein
MDSTPLPTDVTADLPIDEIHVQPGHNPRRYFSPRKMTALRESMLNVGLTTAITVRPRDEGGWWIVAGECRWRCAQDLSWPTIPAYVRQLTDREALLVAIEENDPSKRDGISPAEEALAARRALDLHDGDRAEVLRQLGWSASKLDARLLLLHGTEAVLVALEEELIKIGHAELLSGLPAEQQDELLQRVLDEKITVDALRAQLSTLTRELSAAPFDIAGCTGCPNNSSTQASLFEFHVGTGRCSGRACWDSKVQAFLQEKKTLKLADVPVVFFDYEKELNSCRKLLIDGPHGVGADQFENGCKACGSFGSLICTTPGKEGKTADGVCFDPACNDGMIAMHRAASAPPMPLPAAVTETQAAAPRAPSSQTPPAPAVVKGAKKSKPQKHPPAVLKQAWTQIRSVAADAVPADPHLLNVLMVYGLQCLNAKPDEHNTHKAIAKLLKLSTDELETQAVDQAGVFLEAHKAPRVANKDQPDTMVRTAAALLRALQLEQRDRVLPFQVSKEFLEAHPKSALEALLTEADYWQVMPGADEKTKRAAFKGLLKSKPEDIVKSVMKSKHDFAGFTPSVFTDQIAKSV